jgi:hypothetical protein
MTTYTSTLAVEFCFFGKKIFEASRRAFVHNGLRPF